MYTNPALFHQRIATDQLVADIAGRNSLQKLDAILGQPGLERVDLVERTAQMKKIELVVELHTLPDTLLRSN